MTAVIPATQEERDGLHFDPIDVKFQWSNEEWARIHLPQVRIACLTLQRDDTTLKETMEKMVSGGVLNDLLDSWCMTKDHLEALVDMLNCALTRSFLVLERLGYSPDNPPPDGEPV